MKSNKLVLFITSKEKSHNIIHIVWTPFWVVCYLKQNCGEFVIPRDIGVRSINAPFKMNLRSEIICIDSQYISSLTDYITKNTVIKPNVKIIKPCLNKEVRGTVYTRPYYCAKFAEQCKYVFCWPLSSLKDYDNFSDLKFFYIRHKNKTLGKLALFAPIIVPPHVCRLIPTKIIDRKANAENNHDWLVKISLEKKYLDEHFAQLDNAYFRVQKNNRVFKIDQRLCNLFLDQYIKNLKK